MQDEADKHVRLHGPINIAIDLKTFTHITRKALKSQILYALNEDESEYWNFDSLLYTAPSL